MQANDQPNYPVYRGLQKPLVFKSFKGQYIYWGLGSILLGFLTAMLISSLVNIVTGIGCMVIILVIGLGVTAYFQQRGTKSTYSGIAHIPNNPLFHDKA